MAGKGESSLQKPNIFEIKKYLRLKKCDLFDWLIQVITMPFPTALCSSNIKNNFWIIQYSKLLLGQSSDKHKYRSRTFEVFFCGFRVLEVRGRLHDKVRHRKTQDAKLDMTLLTYINESQTFHSVSMRSRDLPIVLSMFVSPL